MLSHKYALWTLLVFCSIGCHSSRSFVGSRQLAQDWLRAVPEARANLKTVKVEARVEVEQQSKRIRFHAFVMAAFPDRMFVEVSGFALPASLASIQGDDFFVYIPTKRLAYHGSAKQGLLYLLGASLETQEWVRLILGGIPYFPDRILEFSKKSNETVFQLGDKNKPYTLKLNADSGWLTFFQRKEKKKFLTIRFGKPFSTDAGDYPSELHISTPDGSVRIEFTNIEANPKLDEQLFVLSLPKEIKPQTLTRKILEDGVLIKSE